MIKILCTRENVGWIKEKRSVNGWLFFFPKCQVMTTFSFRLMSSSVSKVTTFQDCLGVILES